LTPGARAGKIKREIDERRRTSRMARPKGADGRQTRQAILNAALHLFAERGYFGTNLREIATAVGVRESAIYNYFPSKESLFEELLSEGPVSKIPSFSRVVDEPVSDVRATLIRIAALSLKNYATPREQQLFNVFLSDGMRLAKAGRSTFAESLRLGRARLHKLMRRLVRDGWLRPASPRFLELEFMGPLNMWRMCCAAGLEVPEMRNARAFARQHVDRFLRGAGTEDTIRALGDSDRGRAPSPKSRSRRAVRLEVEAAAGTPQVVSLLNRRQK
jgi:AcrR family transcriptional regulator